MHCNISSIYSKYICSDVAVPSQEWCTSTLHSLSDKYDHLADSRIVKPALAEAVLNSFKAKLVNLVFEQSLYESDLNSSDSDLEWTSSGDIGEFMEDNDCSDETEINSISAVDAACATSQEHSSIQTNYPNLYKDDESKQNGGYDDQLVLFSCDPPSVNEPDTIQTSTDKNANSSSALDVSTDINEVLKCILSDSYDNFLSNDFSSVTSIPCDSELGINVSATSDYADNESENDQVINCSGSSSPASPDSIISPIDSKFSPTKHGDAVFDQASLMINNDSDWTEPLKPMTLTNKNELQSPKNNNYKRSFNVMLLDQTTNTVENSQNPSKRPYKLLVPQES